MIPLTDGYSKENNNKDFNSRSRFLKNYFEVEKWHFGFRNHKNGISFVLIVSITLLLMVPSSYLLVKNDNDAWATPIIEASTIPVYMITTRDGSDPPRGLSEPGYDGNPLGDINQLRRDCPPEVAIFVHGWGLNETEAKERLDRVKMSLEHNGYFVPLVGLSWYSNTQWDAAKSNAVQNGQSLAHFILDYMNTCRTEFGKDVNVRLIAHSMGSRVVLSALNNLNINETWNTNDFKLRSVHLMGAAVDDEEVSMEPIELYNLPWLSWWPPCWYLPYYYTGDGVKSPYGKAIAEEVDEEGKLYNLVNSEDNALELIYLCYEGGDNALGRTGKQEIGISPPRLNYLEIDVKDEVMAFTDADANNVCDFGLKNPWTGICFADIGDNHAGYLGFRRLDDPTLLADDGAMNIVVETFR
jgi:pimeloyl-ACP methyl ester carboxylesterase